MKENHDLVEQKSSSSLWLKSSSEAFASQKDCWAAFLIFIYDFGHCFHTHVNLSVFFGFLRVLSLFFRFLALFFKFSISSSYIFFSILSNHFQSWCIFDVFFAFFLKMQPNTSERQFDTSRSEENVLLYNPLINHIWKIFFNGFLVQELDEFLIFPPLQVFGRKLRHNCCSN